MPDPATETSPKPKKKKIKSKDGSGSSSEGGVADPSTEILIVLMDEKEKGGQSPEKEKASWHAANASLERGLHERTLARKPSRRPSPWDGPVARYGGEVKRYSSLHPHPRQRKRHSGGTPSGSGSDWDSDSDSESDEDWKDERVIPLTHKAALSALGYIGNNSLPSLHAQPQLTNGSFTYSPAQSTMQLPIYAPPPSVASSYAGQYSPYASPYAMSAPSLPAQGNYSPYISNGSVTQSPYVPSRPLSAWGYQTNSNPYASPYAAPRYV